MASEYEKNDVFLLLTEEEYNEEMMVNLWT